jgi:PAS domain S-box-containing protein
LKPKPGLERRLNVVSSREWLSFFSLRSRLILLVLIALIPSLAVIIYTGLELRDYARFKAFDKALDFSKEVSKDYQRLVESARDILFTLSILPQIEEQNRAESSKIFADLLKRTKGYTSFSAINLNGDVIASAHPLDKPINLADRRWFKEVIKSKGFVIGEYLIDRITGKPTVVLAYPVLDNTRNLKAILATGLDLEQIHPLRFKEIFPEASSFNVFDSDGTILLRQPDPGKYVGKSMVEAPIVRTVLTRREGVEETAGLEGMIRLFGFTSLGEGADSLHVSIGIPRKIAFAESDWILTRNLIFLSLIGILSLGAAWLIGGFFILQPVNRLLKITDQLAKGDLTVRSGLSFRYGEIGRLAYSFDQMADSLERREAERNRAEEELENQKEVLQRVIDNIPVMITLYDSKGEMKLLNQEFVRLVGWTAEEARHIDLLEKVYPDPEYRKMAWEYMMSATMDWREFKVTTRDGGILESIWSNVRLSDGTQIGIGIDITERNRSEKEKRVLEEQFYQSQKMEAIGKLAGGVAHDFNNILTVIKGYCQLSLFAFKEGDPLKGNIEEVMKAADRAASLTRQLLAFSRRQIMEMQVLDLNYIIRNLDKMLRRMIGEDIELTTLLADDLGKVKADPGQIEQVLMNLVVNARDAMPKGGNLTIETASVKLDEQYARNHIAVTPGEYVMMAVSDTGIGMSPEVRERIFEPFFTTKEKGKGTGLGLSTVYGIVKQSDGNIWVYSEPGKGTTFKIYLPRVDEPADELRVKVEGQEIPGGSETILLVEDDETVRELAVKILEKHGYEVLGAGSGDEALQICRERKKQMHLVLTDVVMPGMNGRQLAERLQEICHGFKVLYMSGYTDNAIAHHGILEKGLDFIQKPFTPEDLLRKVRKTLDK